MTTFNQIMLVGFLLSSTIFTTASEVTSFEREWNLTVHDVTSDDKTLGKDNTAAYAKCNDISKTERECVLVYEFLHPEGFIFKNKCHLRFQHEKDMNRLAMMKIRAAKEGKVVISYINEQDRQEPTWATAYTIYRVVDMSTCKHYESKVLFNTTDLNEQLGDRFWEGNVFLYQDNTFDTFLAQQNLCEGARCKVTFGPDGQMVDKPVSYLPREMLAKDIKMFRLSEDTSYESFFVLVKDLSPMGSDHGEPTALKLLHASKGPEMFDTVLELNDVSSYDVDDSTGVLGICWSKNKNHNITAIECRQYNTANVETVSASFELPYPVKTMKVKNVWAGAELLLLTDDCEDDLCENNGPYYIRSISRYRKHSGNMEISDLNCSGNKKDLSLSVYKKNSKDDKICISASCRRFVLKQSGKSYNNMQLVRQCFLIKYTHEDL